VRSVLRVNARCGRATKQLRESKQLLAESRVLIETSRLLIRAAEQRLIKPRD